MSGRIDSPRTGWDAVHYEHGRLTWRDDEQTPVTADLGDSAAIKGLRELVRKRDAFADDHRKRRSRARWIPVWVLAALQLFLAFGCAHAPAAQPRPIVLPEKAGSVAAKAIRAGVGQEPKAATIGGYTIVFQPDDADDVCLLEHEKSHAEDQHDMGTVSWTLSYVDQYVECVTAGRAREWCLRNMPLEVVPYKRQHDCERARAEGNPWPPLSEAPRFRGDWSWALCKRERSAER